MVTYRVNPGESRLVVQAYSDGLFSKFGHNPRLSPGQFAGEFYFESDDLASASMLFATKASSLACIDDINEKDRREIERATGDEVLESAEFPEIVFESKTVSADRIYEGFYRVRVNGILSLHGTAHEHEIDTQVRIGDGELRVEGETSVSQMKFGIKRLSFAAGTLKVKDEVKVSFYLIARIK